MNSEVNKISNHTVKQNISEKIEFIPAASHYALKLAFQSIKERYDKLQDRLYTLEDKNERFKDNGNNEQLQNGSGCSRMEILEKKIDELSRQKAQLSHHIFMLANENKDLWSNLSKLTEEKQILVNQLRDLIIKTGSEEKHKEKSKSPSSLQKDNMEAPIETDGNTEDQLKEFPSTDEDNQESLQSLETIKDFSLVQFESQVDLIDGLNTELKEILNKMNEDKVVLQQQQAGLKEASRTMRRIYQGMKIYIIYLQNLKTDNDSSSPETSVDCDSNKSETINESVNTAEKVNLCEQLENNDVITVNDEMICPFCGKLFVKSTLAEEYSKHFLNHVKDCSSNTLVFRFT